MNRTTRWWIIPTSVMLVGMFLFAASLLYGVITVGVPTPDATLKLSQRETRDLDCAEIMSCFGLAITAISFVWWCVAAVLHEGATRTIQ
jgi:hypothetical protein